VVGEGGVWKDVGLNDVIIAGRMGWTTTKMAMDEAQSRGEQ